MLFLQNRDSLFSKLKTQNRERVQNQHYIKLNYTNSNHSHAYTLDGINKKVAFCHVFNVFEFLYLLIIMHQKKRRKELQNRDSPWDHWDEKPMIKPAWGGWRVEVAAEGDSVWEDCGVEAEVWSECERDERVESVRVKLKSVGRVCRVGFSIFCFYTLISFSLIRYLLSLIIDD